MLRISGTKFDVDDYLSKTNWDGCNVSVYHRGEKRPLRSLGIHNDSGFGICVSDGKFDDFEQQKKDVLQFIDSYEQNLRLLSSYDIDNWCAFDFGISTYPPNRFTKTYVLPAALLKLTGDLNIAIVMTNYFTRDDDYLRRRARKHKKAWPIKK